MIYTNFRVVFFDFQEEWQWGGVNWCKNSRSLTTLLLNFSYTHCSPLIAHCFRMQIYEIETLHLDEMQITANNCKHYLFLILKMSVINYFAFSRCNRLRHVARWASPRLPMGFATLRDGHREHRTLPSPHLRKTLPSSLFPLHSKDTRIMATRDERRLTCSFPPSRLGID